MPAPLPQPPLAQPPRPQPHCPAHGDLVLDLARGRLGGARERHAEQARRGCPACRGWWATNLSLPRVDEGVADAVAAFAVERRAPVAPAARGPWLRLAAALALLVGGWLAWTGYQDRTEPAPAQATAAGGALFESGVESGDLAAWTVRVGVADGEPLSVAGLETGDLSEWSGAETGPADAWGQAGTDPAGSAARPDRSSDVQQRQNSQG